MKRRIGLTLLVIFVCSAAGAGMALAYIKKATDTVRSLTELHRIGEMRQHLVRAIQAAQSDLYTVNTVLGDEVDVITDNLAKLEAAAEQCTGCHHTPEVNARIDRMRALVQEYQAGLSYYITASANRQRITQLKLDAASVAAGLLETTETMALQASRGLEARTERAMQRFDEARAILTASILLTLVVAVVVGVWLARSITRPIDQLVGATRAIAAGDIGFQISLRDRTEFGELARHFNSMSAALRDGYRALHAEIEDRKSAEERLLYDAFHDPLTGLPNRALFVDRLQHAIDSTERNPQERYAVLFVELDRIEAVEDAPRGHLRDHLVLAVGERIAAALRPGDTVARLGADAFGVLVQGLKEPARALQVGERIQRALVRRVLVDGLELPVTASIGIAVQSERHTKPDQVLRDADLAMYQAKRKGKGSCELFDPTRHESVVERMRLEADLRRAVEHGEDFLLHYQPVVALRTGKLIAVEALVRWRHAARGLLAAAEFVPVAEETDTVVPLGEWTLRAACRQLRAWQARAPALANVTMSVNLSERQFRHADCVEGLRRIVRESGIDPRQLALEVTERALMGDVENAATKLALLRDMGVQIHVDDFGTSHASLSYLHRFPISAVKIDPSFVAGLPSAESEAVIRAIVSIAESLDFDVIAEGIEAKPQLGKLEDLRCRYGQGVFLCRPMDAVSIEAWSASPPRGVA